MSNLQNGRKKISRRDFVNHAGTLMGLGMVGLNSLPSDSNTKQSSSDSNTKQLLNIRIKNVDSDFEREPLFPYRFKGSAITECWQTAAYLEGESGLSTAWEPREFFGLIQKYLQPIQKMAAMP